MEDCEYNTGYKCLLGYPKCMLGCSDYESNKVEMPDDDDYDYLENEIDGYDVENTH